MPTLKRPRPVATQSTRTRLSWEASTLGAVGNLKLVESSVPSPAEDEVVVGVGAIGLNYADIFMVLGLYEAANKHVQQTGGALCPGLEFAGEVLAIGSAVASVSVGDRVFGFSRFGAYRSVTVVADKHVRKVPAGWSLAQAAAILVQGLTAWHGLVELGAAEKGSHVLVHAAAGGTGCCALQICEALGCEAVGVVSSERKAAFLKERFPRCTPLIRKKSQKAYAAQLASLPEFDVVLESLGGWYLSVALERVAPMGRLVTFGQTNAYGGSAVEGLWKWLKLIPSYLKRPMVDPGKLTPRNQSVMGFNLIWLTERHERMTRELERMFDAGGLLNKPPAVGMTFPFEELPAALDYLRSGANLGKVVVTVGEGATDAV